MSTIQSSIGLITGINIEDTVNRLMAIAGRPRDNLRTQNVALLGEQTAVNQLSATLLALRFSTTSFSQGTFDSRSITTSDETILTATIQEDATPARGSFSFTPLQTASTSQFLSDSIADPSNLGSGTLSVRFGGNVDKGVSLSDLSGGAGFKAGSIKITDRDGQSGVIDLRGAQTIDDVLVAINNSSDIDITASANGDQLVLSDSTGGAGNLRVQEVGGGTTAASLGLSGINVATDTATGADVFYLSRDTKLSTLNDGIGIYSTDSTEELEVDDLLFELGDGTTGGVDLTGAATLGDLLDRINEDDDLTGKITASISADGKRLEIVDDTGSTSQNLVIKNNDLTNGTAADDLGIVYDGDASVTVTGTRIAGGLQDTLVASLRGGAGLDLGDIDITDRNGATATVVLSGAETINEVVDAINASGVGVSARVNDSRNGLILEDTSGGSGNLVIADSGATTTATDLGIAVDADRTSVNSGSLGRRTLSASTQLSTLNGGKGIDLGDFRITNSEGVESALISLDSTGNEAETLGDVVSLINTAGIANGITASINQSGDGLLITDSTNGSETLKISQIGSKSTVADLNLDGVVVTNGSGQQTINGSSSVSIDLATLAVGDGSTALATLNDGNGIGKGTFYVKPATIDPDDEESANAGFFVTIQDQTTVEEVLQSINDAAAAKGFSVEARISGSGAGIEILDTTGGVFQLEISDRGSSGTAAADLKIAGTAPATAAETQRIFNPGLLSTEKADGSLGLLADRINSLGAGITASVFQDANGYRLSIVSDEPGVSNELLIDESQLNFSFGQVGRARDAVVLIGDTAGGTGGEPIVSSSNTFSNVISGVDFTINKTSIDPVTIDVAKDDSSIVSAAESFIDAYNSVRTTLQNLTSFDSTTFETGVLFGSNAALQTDTILANIVTNRFRIGEEFSSLESVGISLGADGKLSLNRAKLEEAFENSPEALENLFLDDSRGVVTKFTEAIDRLSDDENSVLSQRDDTISRKIETNELRLSSMNDLLENERQRLLTEFFTLEETISKMQNDLGVLNGLSQTISSGLFGRRANNR